MSITSRPSPQAASDSSRVRRNGGWVHLCNGLDPRRDGGMVPSILGMTGALAAQGGSIGIVTPTPSQLRETALPPGIDLRGPETNLDGAVRGAAVVHLHGLWQGHTRRGARAARRHRVPYIVAAHGMAEPWALRQKALKKRIYTALVEGKNLRLATCLHALSRPEIDHLRALAPRTPVCLVPNGVDLAPFDALPPRSRLEATLPELAGKTVVLFLSRFHHKKGLDLLADALKAIAPERPDVHLLAAGNDEGARTPFIERLDAHGIAGRVTLLDHVTGEMARAVWAAADAFILPSYSEGFSMAILEALACRIPAVITTACHFPELARAGGGIEVAPTVAGVTAGLRAVVEMTPSDRAGLGQRGRSLVESQYTWGCQAARLADVYRWMAGGGDLPDAVLCTR